MIPRAAFVLARTARQAVPITRPRTIRPMAQSTTQYVIRRAYATPASGSHQSSSTSAADEKIEEITELYATAQDEFEIAMEETEKVSTYAEEDRKAAREEFDKVKQAYQSVIDGEDKALAEEVKRRIGQRIRELEQGVRHMEEMALEQH